MRQFFVRLVTVTATFATLVIAQPRQAAIRGGGAPDRGKCTVEVVVDGAAQVEIRGATATLRTLSGQPAQWRRFECTALMPPNPGEFRFSGVDGRGRQTLVQDPRNGGTAIIRIEDSEGGAEGYTFDIEWGPSGGPRDSRSQPPNAYPPSYTDANREGYGRGRGDDYRPDYRDSDYYHRYHHPFATDEAVRVCQNAVADQAARQFHTRDVHFHGTRIDDNPGRNDWVIGTLDIHRGPREERFQFSCSVNFESGRIRTATIDPRPLGGEPWWH